MRVICKYPLNVVDLQSVAMPAGAEILAVQSQRDVPCLWAMVDPGATPETRRFRTYGTGHAAYEGGKYVGTYQVSGGALVFHLFEVPDE